MLLALNFDNNIIDFFFFFKQKTAYEIKECDWSSDVCSSDLERRNKGFPDHFYIRAKLMETDYAPNITDVSYYPNLQDALDTLMKRDSNHVFLRHELSKNKGIEKHKHKNYDEWVVFRDGKLEIMLDSRSQIVDSTDLKEYCSVYFQKNKNHSVKTLSKINYYVLRNKKR